MDAEQDTGQDGRRRRPSVRIRTKLAVMLLIPSIALAGMVTVRLFESAAQARAVDATTAIVHLARTVNDLMHAVQEERLAAAMLVYADNLPDVDAAALLARFEEAEAATDAARAVLETVREDPDLDPAAAALLVRADKPVDRLRTARRAVYSGQVEEVHLTVYNSAHTRFSAVIDLAVDAAETAELSRHLRTASLLATIDEHSEQLRILVLGLADGAPLAGEYRPFVRLAAAREEALGEYRRITAQTDPDAAVFRVGGLGAAAARPANTLESQVAGSRSDDVQHIDHAALMDAYDARHEATAALIAESIEETHAISTATADTVLQRLALEGATAVAALAIAVLLGSAIGRSVTNGLRRLTGSARQIAMVDLPLAVKRVDEQEGLGGLTPFEFAAQTTPPLRAKGRDELAEVGEAFNIVHREAIRIAAQQALLRYHVGAIFVRLARRGHSLTSRLTSELDEAERNEQDPDRLQRLFRLDHLISLIGRANDSLLVLGGASAAKVRTTDASVSDVLIAAQSRIEYYTRIELVADEGAWVTAPAVDDVVQLLAELMDNATRYSETPAEATAKVLSGRVLVQIRDHGIGIDAERMAALNDRLRRRAPVDLEAMQAMGLTVVGHLAARHGIGVELREAIGGGVIAEIVLPAGILTFEPPSAPPERAEPRAIGGAPAAEPSDRRDAAGRIERRSPAGPPERRNAPLFDQRAPAPRPPVRGVAAIPARPAAPALPAAGRAPGQALAIEGDAAKALPELRFVTRPVHADPSLRAGQPLPQATSDDEPTAAPGGLPQRRPMANLVPGAIAPTPGRPEAPIQRDPKTVGATYSAYARGLAGSRAASTSPTSDTSPTTDTRTNS